MNKRMALIKGDVCALWRTNKLVLVMILLYQAAYCVAGEEMMFLGTLTVVLGGMLSYTTITLDERSGWNRFILTTGYGRDDYICAKYLLAFFGVAAGTVLLFFSSVIACLFGRLTWENSLIKLLPALLAGTLLMLSLVLPLSFRFGMEKARMLSIVTVALACGICGAFSAAAEGMGNAGSFSIFEKPAFNLIALAAAAIAFTLSMRVAVGIYRRKEF